MTLTLNLPSEVEALLLQRSQRLGVEVSSVAIALLALRLSAEDEDFLEAVDGIQRGLDDFEKGQFLSLDEFVAEQNQKYGLSLEA